MTGFARSDGSLSGTRWAWELRSVNGKGLDIRLRLPPGHDGVEPRARELFAARLSRGNLQATLTVDADSTAQRIKINESVLDEVVRAMERIGGRLQVQPPTLDGILSVRGVVEVNEVTRTGTVVRTARFMASRVIALVEHPADTSEAD